MKLKNKQTGEIVIFGEGIVDLNQIGCKNVAEMIEAGWEDYEPKEYWYIYGDGCLQSSHLTHTMQEEMKRIGNYFESREQAEKAVEKLKAWQRLKDKGLKFHLGKYENKYVAIEANWGVLDGDFSDVFILFGGEE